MAGKRSRRRNPLVSLFKTVFNIAIICAVICGFLWYSNNVVYVEEYQYSANIPESFSDYKIVHLTDFHIGDNISLYNSVIEKVSALEPDVIVITGDFIDIDEYDEENALKVARQLCDISDVYYVSGNHEGALIAKQPDLFKKLESAGFKLLDNTSVHLKKGGNRIALAGTKDESMYFAENFDEMRQRGIKMSTMGVSENTFTVFLAHRPENIELYVRKNTLVLSGHAHGGQIYIPFIGGIYAPGQGYLPKYYRGMYEVNGCDMLVNRGIGNSSAPQRIFNQPEVALIRLKKAD